MVTIVATGAALGHAISNLVVGGRIGHFVTECVLWMAAVVILAGPLARKGFRQRLLAALFATEAPGEKA
jgi:hypothetical protein